LVIRYAYLWYREHEQGRDYGTKGRPCVVIVAVETEERETVVTVVPITHLAPEVDDEAVAVPAATAERLGLDERPSWIVVREVSRFVWPGPDLEPVPGERGRFDHGFLPPGLYETMKAKLLALHRRRRLQSVSRST
jgi:PemK-like, MazF-like toxin of type II toxin-antitoxin system